MTYLEIIYETGAMSVVDASDRGPTLSAIKAHHERAVAGEPAYSGEISPYEFRLPAERVVAVYEYDEHPQDASAPTSMSSEVAHEHIADLLATYTDDNGVVDLMAIAAHVLPQPLVEDAPVHESKYVAGATDITKEVLGA